MSLSRWLPIAYPAIALPIAAVLMPALVLGQAPKDAPAKDGKDAPKETMTARGDVKKQIGATDEEWKVIAPLIQKVTGAKRILAADVGSPVSTGGGFGKGFGGGGFGGGGFGGGGGGGGGKKGNGGPGGGGPGGGGPGGGGPGGGGGFGGGNPFAPPPVGTIVPSFFQDMLKLTDEQKKSLNDLQKQVDADLAKLLTEAQAKEMKNFGPGAGGPFRGGFGGGGPMGGPPGGGPGGPGPGGFGGGSDFVGKARADLKAVLDDPAHSAGDVQAKVQAVRDAVERARRNLKSAQDELLEVVTADQAVILLSLGYVDATDTK
jgi:hypothetical protein